MMEQLVVVQTPAGWRIFCKGQWRGRFDYQVDAVDAALRLKSDVELRSGGQAEVVIQDRFGELRRYDHGALRPASDLKASAASPANGGGF